MWHKLAAKNMTIFAICMAISVWLGESLMHYLVFNHGHPFEIIPHDSNELWMRVALCSIIIAFGFYVQKQIDKKIVVEQEKLRTLKATMHTVEDKIGNALISMKFILLDAANSQQVTQKAQADLTKTIDDTISQLRQIRQLDVANEIQFSENIFCLDIAKDTSREKE